MKIRAIINQSKFPIPTKDPIFHIRSKKSQSKSKTPLVALRSNINIKTSSQNKTQVQECLQQLKSSVDESRLISHPLFMKIERLLRQILVRKSEYGGLNVHEREMTEDFEDFQQFSLTKAISKTSLQSNIEFNKNKENFIQSIQITSPNHQEFKIKKHTKMKMNFPEQDKPILQEKIRMLGDKNVQLQQALKGKNEQIQGMRMRVEECQSVRIETERKLRDVMGCKSKSQRDYVCLIGELQSKVEQAIKGQQVIEDRLKQRQAQLILLWQMQLQNKPT